MNDETVKYSIEEFNKELTKATLIEVYNILDEKGYNASNQLVGYLLSGDPGYISSFKDARKKICSMERSQIIEILLKEFLK